MQRGPGRSTTLTSIAAEAGVSVSTVSKVLNGRTDVAPRTRERISQLLRGYGYQVAPGMRFGVVDLLIGSLHGPWAEELIRGAVDAAREAGHSIVVTTVSTAAEFAAWLEHAARRGTDGVLSVLYLPDLAERRRLAAAHLPLVVIDPPTEPGSDIRSVGTTNWQGGMAATRHLAGLGHRRIAAIGGPERFWSANARLHGYRTALMRSGLPVDEALVGRGEFAVPDGRSQAHRLLGLAGTAHRDRGRQRQPGVRCAAGPRRARPARPVRRQRGRIRRRDRGMGHPAAHHHPAAAGRDDRGRLPDAGDGRQRQPGPAAARRTGHQPDRQGQHRAGVSLTG